MIKEGLKMVAAGANPILVKKESIRQLQGSEEIKRVSKKLSSTERYSSHCIYQCK